MHRLPGCLLAMAAGFLAGCVAPAQNNFSAEGLRCEYLVNPLGIDVETPRLSWMLTAGGREAGQGAYRILVAGSLEALRRDRGDLWDSGRVTSSQTTFVPYAGKALASGALCYWKVQLWDRRGAPSTWSEPASWSMGLLQSADWRARWIGQARPADQKEGTPLPSPWLRRNFELKESPRRATAYINALGYYELYINGKKVDDHVLAPAVADFSKRSYYVTHEVGDYLTPGTNCIALWLGRGWYVRGHPGVIHDGPLVRAQIEVTMPGGGAQTLITDDSWRVKASPISPLGKGTAFGDYGGERYDARQELAGWNMAALDDSAWPQAAIFDPPKAAATAQMVEPNRVRETIRAVKVTETPAGAWLIDMGRNLVGWLELKLPAGIPAGTAIKIEYADTTPANGRYLTYNQRDEYIARAGGGQTIRSRFNYHGFRYAHVTGLEKQPAAEDAAGHPIRTDYRSASEFASSSELMNRIYRTANWTYECLTLGGYVVDCPTRERLGYGGDAGTSIETGLFNFETGALYNSWSGNWRDAQDPATGDLPYTAPNYQDQGGGGPMWSGFSVTLPWHVYLQHGDRRALETNYPMMQKWLAFAQSKTKEGLLEPYLSVGMRMAQWNYLGDWVTPRRPGRTDPARNPVSARFINNCYYLYNLQTAAKIARILGKNEDASRFDESAAALGRTLHERFFDSAANSYATGEQPYLALPLLLKITPPALRAAVMKNLEKTIRSTNEGHIDGGMHGAYFLLKTLMEEDRNDLIFEMVSQTTYPGWGYMLEQGATTFWENWSGGSHIHDTLISVGSWFIQGIGGIRIDEAAPGFGHFAIRPAVVGDLRFARTAYRSPRGLIVSNWRLENGRLQLEVTIPPGTSAAVYVPTTNADTVTESGRPAAESPGVRAKGAEGGKAVYEVSSGGYRFSAAMAK